MIKMKTRGRLFVISGPSGCGKTTLCSCLLRQDPGLCRSVSVTTRDMRKPETQGIDYIYTCEKDFKKQIAKGAFLEHAKVFGKHYGTPRAFIQDAINRNRDVLLNIDVQGAAQVQKKVKNAVLIFILPPSMGELKKRLSRRSSDTREQVRKRLAIARRELQAIGQYDFYVINDRLPAAVKTLQCIIEAVRHKI
jgi:guanylate kinase